jgi:DNA-binding transcriptional ArsR family regulator
MFRLLFSDGDLERTRIAATYGPYAEALFSLGVLADGRGSTVFEGWREQVRPQATGWAGPLFRLFGRAPRLDLFTLIGPTATVEESTHAVLSLGRRQLRAEVEAAAHWTVTADGALPDWVFRLADEAGARRGFAAALSVCAGATVGDRWGQIRAHLDAEVASGVRVLAEHGMERFFNQLHPNLRWHGGSLLVRESSHLTDDVRSNVFAARPDVVAGVGDIHLNGQGLVLVPSVFCRRITPYVSVAGTDGPTVLFYPALREITDAHRLWARDRLESSRAALVALLGRTRAEALEALSTACTTTELARRLGVSLPTASHHAAVLREAGLITTRRQGSAVLHLATPLGLALIDGVVPPADRRT